MVDGEKDSVLQCVQRQPNLLTLDGSMRPLCLWYTIKPLAKCPTFLGAAFNCSTQRARISTQGADSRLLVRPTSGGGGCDDDDDDYDDYEGCDDNNNGGGGLES